MLTERPAILDRHVLALDETGFPEAPSECVHQMRGILRRPGAEISNHRHRLHIVGHRAKASKIRIYAYNGNLIIQAIIQINRSFRPGSSPPNAMPAVVDTAQLAELRRTPKHSLVRQEMAVDENEIVGINIGRGYFRFVARSCVNVHL